MNGNVHSVGPAPTDRMGPYLLLTQLGSGAMGRVFLGTDADGRQAAVKVVRSDLAEIPAFRKRFSRELEVAGRVHSPRIAEIFNAQADGERPWLATEYVPGPTLQDAIEQGGGFDDTRLRALAVAIAQALQVIHAAEVVHRDLKPANVLLGPDGPKVIDFGVARALDASLLTNTGQTLGTPAYMSPEQADGSSVEAASDVFALGSLLVFAATGRLAFGDGAPLAILHRVVNNEPDLEGVAVADDVLRRLIKGCLAKDSADRPTPQQIIDVLGEAAWQPLAGVRWQEPPLGVGLPLTAGDAADLPTVALASKRSGKRVAMISGAAAAVVVLAGVAVVEGSGGNGNPTTDALRAGSTMSSSQDGGAFPPALGSASSGGSGSSSSSSGPALAGGKPSPTPNGSVTPPKPAGVTTAAPSSSGQITVTVPAGGPNGGGPVTTPPSTTTAGKPVTHPTTHPTTPTTHSTTPPAPPHSQTPPPAHNPPGPMGAGDISVWIPNWVGMATVDVSWKAHSDATSYSLHYTINGTPATDQTMSVGGTSYSYQIPAGSTTCLQLAAVNQYGRSAMYPSPMYCVNSFGQVVSGG
ncbi:serine/threonine protein kinase [Catenulispora sp. EB89]|uniref:serine/threonine-protein kinase n=1 Tax=Catenulispora sp. EB89 TaxID=3156257 RepID=UPI003517283C